MKTNHCLCLLTFFKVSTCNVILLLFLVNNTCCGAQSWVWGKRGGGGGSIQGNPETIQSIATDSQRNIYATAVISAIPDMDIDGNALNSSDLLPYFSASDAILMSFACDGSYRWSKLFHGQDREELKWVHTDAQDNVYVTGFTTGGGGGNFIKYPNYLDTDVTFPQTLDTPDYFINFIAKYNSNGVLQWLKRVRPPFSQPPAVNNQVWISGYDVDSAGNSFLIANLCPGTYFDGALTVTGPENYKTYALKFDTNGSFINAAYLNMQLNGYGTYPRFYRNPNNGNYYFSASKYDIIDTAVFSGHAASKDTILVCFNSAGQFQWLRECNLNTGLPKLYIVNMAFDSNNDVYLALRLVGSDGSFPRDSFLGYSINEINAPITVMKTPPNVDSIIWTSRTDFGINSANLGEFAINGNELAFSNYSFNGFYWGNQTLPTYSNNGANPLLVRLNKTTGECIGLSSIRSSPTTGNNGDVLTEDNNGDYIMGGLFYTTLYFDNNQQITNLGDQSDFFIAKYASQACAPLALNEEEMTLLKVYPNPTKDKVFFDNSSSQYNTVNIINSLGQFVGSQNIENSITTSIDMSSCSKGMYLLQFIGATNSTTVKVIKD